MKNLLFFIGFLSVFSSCSSEYNERLSNAKKLKKELEIIIENASVEDKSTLSRELKCQIELQARISGNEKQFYSELAMYEPK